MIAELVAEVTAANASRRRWRSTGRGERFGEEAFGGSAAAAARSERRLISCNSSHTETTEQHRERGLGFRVLVLERGTRTSCTPVKLPYTTCAAGEKRCCASANDAATDCIGRVSAQCADQKVSQGACLRKIFSTQLPIGKSSLWQKENQ